MSRQLASRSLGNRTIGNYVIGKNLGEGTFGKVKLGTHNLTGQKVAIKILEKNKITNAADVQRVSRQIHILKLVRHPHIIQLYEIIQTPKQLFLVMQYVSDGQLFEYIVKRRKLKQIQACQFFRQIIAGVQYLHQVGIVHRDLKPQNLLIDYNRRLKLVDFGLSNTYKQKQLLKTACGSPCYAAPQMIAGKKYNPLTADIWSCGIILFAMVCGYLPFEDPNTSTLYKKIMGGQFIIPKTVSPSVKELLEGILNTNPDARFTIKNIKSHPWYKQLGQQSSTYSNGIFVGQHNIPCDEDILQSMTKYVDDVDQVKRYIKMNRHNHSATIYYLLMKKNFKIGINSIYDICSSSFDRRLLQLPSKQLHNQNTIDSLQLDRNTTRQGNRSFSKKLNRVNFHTNNNYFHKKKQETIQLNLDLDNLPIVDNLGNNLHKKKRVNFHMKPQTPSISRSPKNLNTTLYDIQQINHYQPHYGNIRRGRPPTTYKNGPISFRTSLNKTKVQNRQQRWQQTRYQSLDNSQQKQIMTRTFMGGIPKGYIPRWQNESQRIRDILNTTISGHSKKRKHKLGFF